MRPIDADALLTDRRKRMYYHLPNGDTAIPIIDIEHAPTIEERKTARWRYSRNISSISYSDMMITCDQCGYTKERCHGDVLNFCPNCGADMRERREEHEQNRK